jgi:hypothetical protein
MENTGSQIPNRLQEWNQLLQAWRATNGGSCARCQSTKPVQDVHYCSLTYN